MAKIKGISGRAKAELLKDLNDHRMALATDIKPTDPAIAHRLIATTCDCGTQILVHPPRTDEPTKQVCPDCAADIISKARAEGREVKVVQRPVTNKHAVFIDGVPTPVETKEAGMQIDLNNLTDAELGAIVRERMLAQRAQQIAAEVPVAVEKRAKAEKKAEKAHKKGRKKEAEREEQVTAIMVALECSEQDAIKELAKFEEALA